MQVWLFWYQIKNSAFFSCSKCTKANSANNPSYCLMYLMQSWLVNTHPVGLTGVSAVGQVTSVLACVIKFISFEIQTTDRGLLVPRSIASDCWNFSVDPHGRSGCIWYACWALATILTTSRLHATAENQSLAFFRTSSQEYSSWNGTE